MTFRNMWLFSKFPILWRSQCISVHRRNISSSSSLCKDSVFSNIKRKGNAFNDSINTECSGHTSKEIPIQVENLRDPKDEESPLYKHHIPTNIFQKGLLSVGAATTALLDPRRHDMVAVLGETASFAVLPRLYQRMKDDPEGQEVLLEKPRINSKTINLQALSELPEGSLGHAYVKFLKDNKVTPDSRLPVQFVDNRDFAYVMQRYRECHDLFHTLLGMPTNMLGEVAVKWVEGLQTGLPMCIGGAIFGPLRFKPKQRQKYIDVYLPWAVQVGRKSKLLMNIYYEKRWEQSLDELRLELNIDHPPDIK
ncbi:coenzyme Q4 [Oratosquilla oratoria]|uniref:coenzyme Q4 n=1 Tax=Oratosquilla oratoria TaxID=337810 RepID=UPI003F76EF25